MVSVGSRLKRASATIGHTVADLAGRLRPGAAGRPPWDRSVLDDIAMRRPWNLRIKRARWAARTRLRRLDDGVTVIIVNWNTKDITADVVKAVRLFSPDDVRVLVVDNGSSDGSAEMFRTWPGIDTMLLHSNAGHGAALDLAVCSTRTKVAVTLDSDAIPLATGWLDQIVEPVCSGRAVLAGQQSSRGFVHPIYAAVDTAAFVRRGLSFQVHRLPGMTAGGVVYHHGGVSRATDGAVTLEALAGWRAAWRSLGVDLDVVQPAHREVPS